MNEWKPIDTAPKSGQIVDLWGVFPDGRAFRIPDCKWHIPQQCWKSIHYSGAGYSRLNPKQVLTHWCYPIDPPPYEEWKPNRD